MERSDIGLVAREFKLKKPPDRLTVIQKVDRRCNRAAHDLCQLSRRELSCGVLLGAIPPCAFGIDSD